MLTARKTTSLSLSELVTSVMIGNAIVHGPHHVAQKSSTTTLPFCSARLNLAPSTVSKLKEGAGLLTSGWTEAGCADLSSKKLLTSCAPSCFAKVRSCAVGSTLACESV